MKQEYTLLKKFVPYIKKEPEFVFNVCFDIIGLLICGSILVGDVIVKAIYDFIIKQPYSGIKPGPVLYIALGAFFVCCIIAYCFRHLRILNKKI